VEIEKQYEWMRRGKKFKTKYFAALGELFKSEEVKDDHIEKEKDNSAERGSGTDKIRDLA
jgi:hypothetical protein